VSHPQEIFLLYCRSATLRDGLRRKEEFFL
jgi:hypothetical protein